MHLNRRPQRAAAAASCVSTAVPRGVACVLRKNRRVVEENRYGEREAGERRRLTGGRDQGQSRGRPKNSIGSSIPVPWMRGPFENSGRTARRGRTTPPSRPLLANGFQLSPRQAEPLVGDSIQDRPLRRWTSTRPDVKTPHARVYSRVSRLSG